MKVTKVHCRLDKSPLLDPILIQINPAIIAVTLDMLKAVVVKGVTCSLIYQNTRRHIADDSYIQQDRPCMYTKTTLRRVRVTTVAVETQ
jgi:hypothetical protein